MASMSPAKPVAHCQFRRMIALPLHTSLRFEDITTILRRDADAVGLSFIARDPITREHSHFQEAHIARPSGFFSIFQPDFQDFGRAAGVYAINIPAFS
jgi:hypothetical protein